MANILKILNSYKLRRNRVTIRKVAKYMHRHSQKKKKMKMAPNHMKRCSNSLLLRVMQMNELQFLIYQIGTHPKV